MADEYVQVHPTMLSHRKLRKLARDLDLPLVVARGHLVTLWMNCLCHAQDGNLVDMDNDDVAHYAEWDDNADRFVTALVRHGWLDVTAEANGIQRLEIHDWGDFTGRFRLAERRRYERERKALQRARKRNLSAELQPALCENVPGTATMTIGTDAKCPALTEQNRTEHVVVALEADKTLSSLPGLETFLMTRIGCPALPPKWIGLAGQLLPLRTWDVEEACRIARRRTPNTRAVNAGLVMRILEAKRLGARTEPPAELSQASVSASSTLKGLELLKAKAHWQAVFNTPDVAWSVHDDEARFLEKLGLCEGAVLELARETIEAVGDSWAEFFWRAEAVRGSEGQNR